jgi:CcmD family protein
MKKISITTICNLLIINLLSAQSTTPINANRGMGMNVVITVIAIIFTGIVLYLINLDRKISKLEKEVNNG